MYVYCSSFYKGAPVVQWFKWWTYDSHLADRGLIRIYKLFLVSGREVCFELYKKSKPLSTEYGSVWC